MSTDTDDRFVRFVEERSADLRRVALRLCGNDADATDLTQSALEKAYRQWRRVEASGDPYPYVRQIVVNSHIDGWRRGRLVPRFFHRERGISVAPTDVVPVDAVDTAPDLADRVAGRREVAHLLAALPPRERAVLVLRYLEDLSEADTAAELGIAVGTVKSTCHKALERLRALPQVPAPTLPSTSFPASSGSIR